MLSTSDDPHPPGYHDDLIARWRDTVAQHQRMIDRHEAAIAERRRDIVWAEEQIADHERLRDAERERQHVKG